MLVVEIQHLKSTVFQLRPSPEQFSEEKISEKTGEWGKNTKERHSVKIEKRVKKCCIPHNLLTNVQNRHFEVYTFCTHL